MRKIIKASAGTGKTYTLSLEYINILLSFPQVSFEEIVVITFTKKATAEIRERIFEHLKSIMEDKTLKNPVVKNLKKINPDINFKNLNEQYKNLICNKDKIRITTIDAFINSVFKNIISSYLNIGNYEIDPEINEKYLPLIFNFILNSENIEKFNIIFKNFKAKTMTKFNKFIKRIIDERWIFDFAPKEFSIKKNPDEYYKVFISNLNLALNKYADYLKLRGIYTVLPANRKMNKDFWEFLEDTYEFKSEDLAKIVLNHFETLKTQNRLSYFKIEKFIPSIRGKMYNSINMEIKELLSVAKQAYIDYLFLTKFKEEHFAIFNLASEILKFYDLIKFNTKVFTYSDISYYTFKYLYDANILANPDFSVLNLFYEKLAYNTRFLLIDEFQDTSIIQWNIINPIIREIISGEGQKHYGGTIIVGDEKQAIYGWRGGERELLINSDRFIPFAEYNTLDTSFRSKKVIVDFINELFLNISNDWHYENMLCVKEQGYVKVQFTNTYNFSQQLYYKDLLEKNLLPILNKIDMSETAIIARTNSELEEIAAVLKQYNINYLLEASSLLTELQIIKSILFLLKFIAKSDFKSLIKFLRSDVILAKPTYLQKISKIFQSNPNATITEFLQSNKDDEIIGKIENIYNQAHFLKVSQVVGKILKDFSFYSIFTNEIDYVNLDYFLSLINDFEESDTANSLVSFLDYLEENKQKFKQMQSKDNKIIKLLTVHKSKGLGFKNVFVFFKLTKKGNLSFFDLQSYYRFNSDYSGFTEFYATLNFNAFIKETSLTDIYGLDREKKFYEEINALYVALTRAKNNLFLFLQYSKKEGLDAVFENVKSQPAIYLFNKFYLKNNFKKTDDVATYEKGVLKLSSNKPAQHTDFLIDLKEKIGFTTEPKELIKITENHFAKFVLDPKSILGTVTHYYLSFIKLNYKKEKEVAKNRVIAKYGSILSWEQIKNIIAKTDEFVIKNYYYFNAENWDDVFCEFSVFDENNEFRIDRLLIKDKQIFIIDFKTGEKYDKRQLQVYKSIVKKIMPDYEIMTKYLEIKL